MYRLGLEEPIESCPATVIIYMMQSRFSFRKGKMENPLCPRPPAFVRGMLGELFHAVTVTPVLEFAVSSYEPDF